MISGQVNSYSINELSSQILNKLEIILLFMGEVVVISGDKWRAWENKQ